MKLSRHLQMAVGSAREALTWHALTILFLTPIINGWPSDLSQGRTVSKSRRHTKDVEDPVIYLEQNLTLQNNGCYSCAYRGFLFPDKKCHVEKCEDSMTCFKMTAFVNGDGEAPWVAHNCAQAAAIESIKDNKQECDVIRAVIQRLDPEGGPAHGTTFNRCAIHTCDNSATDIDDKACNDGRLGPLWCWEYAIELDEEIIKESSKNFTSEEKFNRAKQNWLQNQRNATKCSDQGLDSCLTLEGSFRNRRWSLQTCAARDAVQDMITREEACSYLQDTLSHGKMGKHIIKFQQNDSKLNQPGMDSSCTVRTCDKNGCNAEVPFFHLQSTTVKPTTAATSPPSSIPPSRTENTNPPPSTSYAVTTIDDFVTRPSSSSALAGTTAPSRNPSLRPSSLSFIFSLSWFVYCSCCLTSQFYIEIKFT